MSFATLLALLVGVLVAAPLAAHLLRRRRVERLDFPPARLVGAAQPVARQRARLEDRALFAVRALVVAALAVLGATPFVSCSRLSLGRRSGGSVAVVLVVDDSLSMQAIQGQSTRFERAREGAREVIGSLHEGDAVALLAAGSPARVLLAATSDLATARAALDSLAVSDRATDLDGALSTAAAITRALPQTDRRIVLLSDLADGQGEGSPPVGVGLDLPLWAPLDELRVRVPDCAVVRAIRQGAQLSAEVACGDDADAEGRALQVRAAERVLVSAPLERRRHQSLALTLPDGATGPLRAQLTGRDAIVSDDLAPVTTAASALQVGVVSDLIESALVTGGPSPVEQALAALDETLAIRPLPVIPDAADALTPYSVVVLDDPPGLTPEARSAFATWLQLGGVGLLWVGPRSGGAILGASFEPFFQGPVRWMASSPPGADLASAAVLGESAEGLRSLGPHGRALLDARASDGASLRVSWSDGQPLLWQRSLGQGSLTVVTLPASAEVSDLPLRPAFLDLLARSLDLGRAHQSGQRSVVGQPWTFRSDALPTLLEGPSGPLPLHDQGVNRVATPDHAGLYAARFGERSEPRVVEIDAREVDTRPRAAPVAGPDGALGSQRARIDASPYVAFVLLLAIAAESALRLRATRSDAAVA